MHLPKFEGENCAVYSIDICKLLVCVSVCLDIKFHIHGVYIYSLNSLISKLITT